MTKTQIKKARYLHEESREYRGLRRVADYKRRANRIERRTLNQRLRTLDDSAERAEQH